MKKTLIGLAMALVANGAALAQVPPEMRHLLENPNELIRKDAECKVPFPEEAMAHLPAGFKGEVVALLTFNVAGEFRFARVMQSSGNEKLDDAALYAALESSCEPFGDPSDPRLEGSLIGLPFIFTFDNSRGGDPVEVLPVQ